MWHHKPCPKCGSSDGLSFKDDEEWGYCFVCKHSTGVKMSSLKKPVEVSRPIPTNIEDYPTRGFQERNIRRNIAEHYGVKVKYREGTEEIISHFYPYTKAGKVVGYKERKLPKEFLIHGDAKGSDLELFGTNVASGDRRLIATEGELDAMAVAQAQYDKYQKFYPVVSLSSASQVKNLINQREWLRGFQEVILMFDQDEPGQKAAVEAAKIIGYDKVKIAKLPEKDPCDTLLKHGSEALMAAVFNARPYSPAGVVRGEAIWEEYKSRKNAVSVDYPACLSGINKKTRGMRMGEIVLFTSGTGSGKSTIIKEIILDLLQKTEDMIGLISLEESIGDTAEKLIGMHLKKNLEDAEVDEEKEREAFEHIFGSERILIVDHQGSVSDDTLLGKIEYLALAGCRYIILDHITIAVSEGAEGKTGNEAVDYVMSSLLKIVKKYNVWMGIVSHLRKSPMGGQPFEAGKIPSMDDIKGSGSLKQIAFDIIGFSRDMTAEEESIRNTINFSVLKCRRTGNTGPAGSAVYDTKTGRIKKVSATMMDFKP